MLKSDYATQNCSIARALEVVGERWTLLIVRELLLKPWRFSDLVRRLDVSKNVLAGRLTKLVEMGVVDTETYDANHDWNSYRLTPMGRELFPAVNALMAWGDKYFAPDGPPVVFMHSCDGPAGNTVVCQTCGEELTADNFHPRLGPGFHKGAPESEPAARRRPTKG
jgi:DNA-binding HxlR family transcriptional regulator